MLPIVDKYTVLYNTDVFLTVVLLQVLVFGFFFHWLQYEQS